MQIQKYIKNSKTWSLSIGTYKYISVFKNSKINILNNTIIKKKRWWAYLVNHSVQIYKIKYII